MYQASDVPFSMSSMLSSISEIDIPTPIPQIKRVSIYLFLQSILIFIFVIPVVIINFPQITEFFGSTNLIRIIDPVFTLPAMWMVYSCASGNKRTAWMNFLFVIGAAIYVEGHGI